MEVRIRCTPGAATKLLLSLILLDLAFLGAYIPIHILAPEVSWGPARGLFDLDAEPSIPAWFSSIQLFVTGAVLWAAAQNNRRKQHLSSTFLVAAGVVFIFLSMDEAAAVHEKITLVVLKLEMDWLLFKGGHGAWIPLYMGLGLIGLLVAAPYLYKTWVHFRREAVMALRGFVVLVSGAVGLEILSYLFLRANSSATTLYRVEVACEEFLELAGASIILCAVLLLADAVSSGSPLPVHADGSKSRSPRRDVPQHLQS